MFAFGCWAGKKSFCKKKVHVKMIWKQFLYNFMVLLNGPVQNALFCLMDRYRNVCVWLLGRQKKVFARKKVHVKMIWKQFFSFFLVLLNGPVQNALFCLMDRYRNVCVWFMARNCRFPKVGTHGCQRGNHRLPLQGTAGSHRLEVMVPNLGTRGYHCKQLPVPRGCNSCFPTWEP